MFGTKRFLAVATVVAGLVLVPGCNSHIDDPSSADVFLEIENPTFPPVTAAIDATSGNCIFTFTTGTASFKNKPKNSLSGTSPFNDILLEHVVVTYLWDDAVTNPGGGFPGPATFGLGGSVPANGTSSATFAFVNGGDLTTSPSSRDGHSAFMHLTFSGHTVAGDPVSAATGGNLLVSSCI